MDEHDGPSPVWATAEEISRPLLVRLRALVADRDRPLFVGLDGRSGSGKSTLTAVVKRDLESDGSVPVTVSVIEGDQFYGGGSSATWDARGPEEKAARVIDWRRQHDVLERLHDAGVAEWRSFDWYADDWDADVVPLVAEPVTTLVSRVVILEGAYSCRPELEDVLDLRVLLDVPRDVRRRQLLVREGDTYRADWERRWSAAEDHYFGSVMPASKFDLIIP